VVSSARHRQEVMPFALIACRTGIAIGPRPR
jgi:hypothetical protein